MRLEGFIDPADPPLITRKTSSGHRSTDATEFRRALTPHLSSRGITRVAKLSGFDHLGVPAHMAVRPQGRTLSSGSGKGLTDDASWVSAVMECLEQAAWEEHAPDVHVGSENSLRALGLNVIEADGCAQVHKSQYHPDMVMGWVAGIDISRGEQVWVPEGTVTISARHNHRLNPFVTGSNGLASGAHVLEALLSGLLEVIERDGMSVHHGSPTADADSMISEAAPGLLGMIERAGLTVRVADCATELGIPVVNAYLHERPDERIGLFKGCGASLDTHVALVRAVIEAAQGRSIIVAGARDDVFESMRTASMRRTSIPAPEATGTLSTRVNLSTGSIEGDLEFIVTRLAECGFDRVIAVRHSKPGDLVQVVRVIVPGLDGYPFETAEPGRRARQHERAQATT